MRQLQEVLIIAEDDDYWPIHRNRRFLAKNMEKNTAPAQYVAVYRGKTLRAIVCYGKVTRIDENVPYSEVYKDTKFSNREGFARVYHVEEFVDLENPVYFEKEIDGSAIRSREYCKFADLFTAKTLRDLRKKQ